MQNKYIIQQVEWLPNQFSDIEAIYNMLKDQERKIFDLSYYTTGCSIMDYVEKCIKEDYVFIVRDIDNFDICACFILAEPRMFENIITRVDVHTAIRKKYWGKQSREIALAFRDYAVNKYNIKKFVATVPQCGYGIIKLLKDIGFKHEGTLKESVIFRDKNGKPKFYDELIYSLTDGGIKI